MDSYWGKTVETVVIIRIRFVIRSSHRETSVTVFENPESHSRDSWRFLRVRVIEIHHSHFGLIRSILRETFVISVRIWRVIQGMIGIYLVDYLL